METSISGFIRNLMILVAEVEKLFPGNGEVLSLGNKIRIFKNEIGREELVLSFGGVLFNYSNQIRANNGKFFCSFGNIKKSINNNNSDVVVELFSSFREKYNDISEEKKKLIFEKLNNMLDCYDMIRR